MAREETESKLRAAAAKNNAKAERSQCFGSGR